MKPTIFQLITDTALYSVCVCARALVHVHVCSFGVPTKRLTHARRVLYHYATYPAPQSDPTTTKEDLECVLRGQYYNIPLDLDIERWLLALLMVHSLLLFTWVGLIGGGGALRFFGVPLLSELILET